MFRKVSAVFFFFLVLLVSLSASQNSQKYYAVSSVEWQSVSELCHLAGVVGPSSNGPVTEAQLLIALERAEKYLGKDNCLLQSVKKLLGEDCVIYADDFGSVSLSLALSPEVYAQTGKPYGEDGADKPGWNVDGDWFIARHTERGSVATLLLENTFGDSIYGRFAVPYRQKVNDDASSDIWNRNLHFSFYGSKSEQNFPFDCGISLGYKGFSLIIARGKVSFGEGYTGNTAVGDNYDYQEFVKAGFWTRNTGISLNLTYFDSSRDPSKDTNPWDVQVSKFSGYMNIRHTAAYEVVFLDRVRVSLDFITMLDTDSAFDFRYLNPFMVLHSMYNFHEGAILEANNMAAVEVSWAIARKWNMHFQFTMDQIQIKGEAAGYSKHLGYTDPNAFASLLNLSYTDTIDNKGVLNLYTEAVFTTPGMYLNSKYYDKSGNVTQFATGDGGTANIRCWSQDYLVGYARKESNNLGDVNYSGYIYGPDCFVAALGGEYRVPSLYSVAASVFYMAHGEKGRGESASNYNFDGINTIDKVNSFSLTGTVEHTLAVKLEGEVKVWKYMKLYLAAAFSERWNYRNTDGRKFSNFQTCVGFTLSTSEVTI